MIKLFWLLLLTFAVSPVYAEEISIRRADGAHAKFDVERAQDEASRLKGLMFREKLEPSEGMLFIYDKPGRRAFWMKNTYIPLDILFFTSQGELVHIHPRAKPHSLQPVGPDRADICAVLEIGAGEADKIGLKAGDRLMLTDSSACLP